MPLASGSQLQALVAFESTYGTAPSSGFFRVPLSRMAVRPSQVLIDSDLLGLGRDAQRPVRDMIRVEGDLTVPVDLNNIGIWLKGLLGSPTTSGTSPKTHTYTSGSNTLPSMAIEVGYAQVPTYRMFVGVGVNSMQIECRPSGLVRATVDLIGANETSATSSQGGTPTTHALTEFSPFQAVIRRSGSALATVRSCTWQYANDLEPIEVIRNTSQIVMLAPGTARCSGQLTALFESTTLLDQALNGTATSFEIEWSIDANQKLTLSMPNVMLERTGPVVEGPRGIMVEFQWRSFGISGTPMATAVLVNSISSY